MHIIKKSFLALCLVPFSLWSCRLETDIVKKVPDKELRTVDAWLQQHGPKTVSFSFQGEEYSKNLNWSGLIYHIALPEIKCPFPTKNCSLCKLQGLHHDYLGKLEKTSSIQFTHIRGNQKESAYHAHVQYNTMAKESTFFPQDWTLKKIAQELLIAFKNAKMINNDPISPYFVGTASNGMNIVFLITSFGHVGSAYPQI